MSQATTVTRGPASARAADTTQTDFAGFSQADDASTSTTKRRPSDDEILGIDAADENAKGGDSPRDKRSDDEKGERSDGGDDEPANLRAAFEANPELRQAWQDAQAYREAFATPEEARAATSQLADLGRMDALFFSRRPGDHAELARMVAEIDPAAFASLAEAMGRFAEEAKARGPASGQPPAQAQNQPEATTQTARQDAGREQSAPASQRSANPEQVTPAQEEFFRATNAEAVQSVIDAIESQVERLLPEKTSKSARHRVVGEIYRELDGTLRANGQFTRQVREALRGGTLDAAHQRAIVSLISGRARQALPAVAKRVLNEWTSTMVAASQDRRERQRSAERRVDIAGSSGGSEGRRTIGARDIDYGRMSDADILNL